MQSSQLKCYFHIFQFAISQRSAFPCPSLQSLLLSAVKFMLFPAMTFLLLYWSFLLSLTMVHKMYNLIWIIRLFLMSERIMSTAQTLDKNQAHLPHKQLMRHTDHTSQNMHQSHWTISSLIIKETLCWATNLLRWVCPQGTAAICLAACC